MVQSQFSLSWDSYKSNLFSGFSVLQQNGEFVDMTLAADGHMVKVHQVLVALASPYIKDLIATAPCQHPVIFLNNVSHRNLCLLLEYIYTGEVVVPSDCFTSFSETAKALHIKGLENIGTPDNLPVKMSVSMPEFEDSDLCHISGVKTLSVPVSDQSSDRTQITLPAAAQNIFFKRDPNTRSSNHPPSNAPTKDEVHDYTSLMDDSGAQDSDDGFGPDDTSRPVEQNTAKDKVTSNLQFTVSIRGSLQVILNRYIYNLHSTTTRTGVRRWRCVDYRNNKCSAFVVTKGNVVLNRANLHNHSFHDKKILAKIEKKAVYSAIDEVEGYKEKEDGKLDTSDVAMESDGFLTMDDFNKDKTKTESV